MRLASGMERPSTYTEKAADYHGGARVPQLRPTRDLIMSVVLAGAMAAVLFWPI